MEIDVRTIGPGGYFTGDNALEFYVSMKGTTFEIAAAAVVFLQTIAELSMEPPAKQNEKNYLENYWEYVPGSNSVSSIKRDKDNEETH